MQGFGPGGVAVCICLLQLGLVATPADAARYRTRNFEVSATDPSLAKAVGDAAEQYRSQLAVEWIGRELPPWRQTCPIQVTTGPRVQASGLTRFTFRGRTPGDWHMEVRGTPERILDSVLPHEVTHTVFATHFGRPLPRWADEGACTTVEHPSEKAKQDQLLLQFLSTNRGIAFRDMFAMTDYPDDMLPLYSQGYSLTRFLISHGGRRRFVRFLGEGMQTEQWGAAVRRHYGFPDLASLQLAWVDWVRQGSPVIGPTDGPRMQLASLQQSPTPVRPVSAVTGVAEGETSWYAAVRDGKIAAPEVAAAPPAGDTAIAAGQSTAAETWTLPSPPARVDRAEHRGRGQVIYEWGVPAGGR